MKHEFDQFESVFSKSVIKPLKKEFGMTEAELKGYRRMRNFLDQVWDITMHSHRYSRSKKDDPRIMIHFCGKRVCFGTKDHKLSVEEVPNKWDNLLQQSPLRTRVARR